MTHYGTLVSAPWAHAFRHRGQFPECRVTTLTEGLRGTPDVQSPPAVHRRCRHHGKRGKTMFGQQKLSSDQMVLGTGDDDASRQAVREAAELAARLGAT